MSRSLCRDIIKASGSSTAPPRRDAAVENDQIASSVNVRSVHPHRAHGNLRCWPRSISCVWSIPRSSTIVMQLRSHSRSWVRSSTNTAGRSRGTDCLFSHLNTATWKRHSKHHSCYVVSVFKEQPPRTRNTSEMIAGENFDSILARIEAWQICSPFTKLVGDELQSTMSFHEANSEFKDLVFEKYVKHNIFSKDKVTQNRSNQMDQCLILLKRSKSIDLLLLYYYFY